ncbi:MAG TPA: PIG-L family deacetylase [Candidatus Saccharimonadales bacterium]|nr:PIG-L family deacetylase [Candidatus Saccharimonadales bacterium]
MATVLFAYAHPDDESFGIAGTALKLAAAGHTTALITLTRGDAGLWHGRSEGDWARPDLGAERTREWEHAVEVIGFRHSRLLGWPDGGLAGSPVEEVTAEVVGFIREVRPDVVCTFGPEGAGSEHDDHRAASFFAARAFARAAVADQYPERGPAHAARRLFFNASPYDGDPLTFGAMAPTHVIDISAFRDRKAAAFECHKTQFKDRDFFYQLLERRKDREYFHLAIDRAGLAPHSLDLLT